MNAYQVRDDVLAQYECAPENIEMSPGERGVLVGMMNSALRGEGKMDEANYKRHIVLAWLFRDLLNKPAASEISTKELTPRMWWALYKYVDPHKNEDEGFWRSREDLPETLAACVKIMEEWEREMQQQLNFNL